MTSGLSEEKRATKEIQESLAMQEIFMTNYFKVGDLGVDKAKIVGRIGLSDKRDLKLKIRFSSPENGTWAQESFIKRVIKADGSSQVLSTINKIRKDVNNGKGQIYTLTMESSPKGFPVNKHVEPPWSN